MNASDPVTMSTEEKSCVVEEESIVLTLSTSLARRLMSSPCVRLSKSESGRPCTFVEERAAYDHYDALRHARDPPFLQPREQRAGRVGAGRGTV